MPPIQNNHALRPRHFLVACALIVIATGQAFAEGLNVSVIQLPALRINGEPAKAHTQGLEVIAGKYYATARRDDKQPRRALLLRTDAQSAEWDSWDITPLDSQGALTPLDHPGGMQGEGDQFWIPLAESKRNGRSLIRRYHLSQIVPGRTLKPDFEFSVDDHIGALAISAERKWILGANWDTQVVYLWDFEGRLQQTFHAGDLSVRGLGVISGAGGRAGLAVQDWKIVGDRLFASGLFRGPGPRSSQSRLVSFTKFAEAEFQSVSVDLPKQNGTELAREAMSIADDHAYFLPEDLGATNRLFRVSLDELMPGRAAR
jgi:hypothetical protein